MAGKWQENGGKMPDFSKKMLTKLGAILKIVENPSSNFSQIALQVMRFLLLIAVPSTYQIYKNQL